MTVDMTPSVAESSSVVTEKQRVAMSSIAAAILITGLKLVVGLMTNSLGILSEAAHSGLDLIAAVMTYLAVSVSDRPPDEEHQYGHAKIENVSAFIQTLLLIITCAWIIKEAVERLVAGTAHVEANVWGFSVIAFAIIVDISRSRALRRVARKYNSQALEADALHFASDIWSSLVVIAGLAFVSFGYVWLDAVAAMAVAFLVLFVSYRLGRRTIDALMDRVPSGVSENIQSAIRNVDGVEEVRSARLRSSGAKIFVDATVAIRRTVPFQQAHSIMDNVEKAVHAVQPNTDVVVHAEPYKSADESIADKIRMIVLERGLRMPHNLEVHHSDEKYHVDFDVEYARGKSFVDAHDLASEIEDEIKMALPSVEKVTIHMEEFEPGENEIVNETGMQARLEESIRQAVLADRRILRCGNLVLLRVGNKYNLSLDCSFEKGKTLGEVHQIISQMEATLYEKFKALRRITVHAEPSG